MSENGNRAAYPSEVAANESDERRGLTKREAMAKDIMSGLCGDCNRGGSHSDYALDACKFADALLAELERTKKP